MNRDVRILAEWCLANGPCGGIRDAARRLLAPRRSRATPRHPAVGAEKERRRLEREERRRRLARIRESLQMRAGPAGECELCQRTRGTEAHHVLSGPDRRRKESPETMLWLCLPCHRRLHAGDEETLELAQTYCAGSGMHDATAALRKRIDKLWEARGAARASRDAGSVT